VVIAVNQATLHVGENVYESMGEAFMRLLENYTDEQLQFLVRYHEQVIEKTRQEIIRLSERIGINLDCFI
jgi:hypothetical protein